MNIIKFTANSKYHDDMLLFWISFIKSETLGIQNPGEFFKWLCFQLSKFDNSLAEDDFLNFYALYSSKKLT